MRPYNPTKPLVHLHIPKTGGTSFRKVLLEMFGDDRVHTGVGIIDNDLFPGNVYTDHYISNELPWETQDHPDHQLVTFIRDPFEQKVSLYHYTKGIAGGLLWLKRKHVPMEQYATTLPDFVLKAPFDPFDFLPSWDFPRALDQFVFVGILENFQTCANSFAQIVNRYPIKVPHEAGVGRDEEPPAGLKEEYRKLRPDLFELYSYVVKTWSPIWNKSILG